MKPLILFISRPILKKGWEVVQKLRGEIPEFKLITLSGTPNHQLPDYLNAADLVITAAQYKECFSRVILESLFCGTQVIYSSLDTAREYLEAPYALPCKPTVLSLKLAIKRFFGDTRWQVPREEVRAYAMREFGEKNLEVFKNAYKPYI